VVIKKIAMKRLECKFISLYKKQEVNINLKSYINCCLEIFKKLNIFPSHIGITGKGYHKKIVKYYNGIKKLESNNYESVESINIFSIPQYSNAPSYEWSFLIGINLREGAEFFLGGNDADIGHLTLTEILIDIFKLVNFDYGFGSKMNYSKGPEYFVAGVQYGDLTNLEMEDASKWLKDSLNEKSFSNGRLRNIYEINFITQNHLKYELSSGFTLSEFILSQKQTKLKNVYSGLYEWIIPNREVIRIRNLLLESEILITK
jgi:hypothetical protein